MRISLTAFIDPPTRILYELWISEFSGLLVLIFEWTKRFDGIGETREIEWGKEMGWSN
jgi:hypothetical protein